MGNPVVHFEIIGPSPSDLRGYYAQLFGWQYDQQAEVAPEVSAPRDYGFTTNKSPDGIGIPAGVGGGPTFTSHTLAYVGVEDVGVALAKAESLGGKRVMGPTKNPGRNIMVAHFTDPAGNLVGLAGPK